MTPATASLAELFADAPEELRRDPAGLASYLAAEGIERATLPVLILQQLAESWAEMGPPATLRELASTGEQLQITPPVVELFARRPDLPLHNLYGPSESHVVTAYALEPEPRRWPSHPAIVHSSSASAAPTSAASSPGSSQAAFTASSPAARSALRSTLAAMRSSSRNGST